MSLGLETAWRERAACRDADTALFFTLDRVDEARQLCAQCVVRGDCAAQHVDERFGVWAGEARGLDEDHHRACWQSDSSSTRSAGNHLWRGETLPDDLPPVCEEPTRHYPDGRRGTITGYGAHQRADQTPCAACDQAHYAYNLARRQRNPGRSRAKPKHQPTRSGPMPAGMACWVPTDAWPLGRRGTAAGATAHRRAGEPICVACRVAANATSRRSRRTQPMTQPPRRTRLDGNAACEQAGQRRNGPRTGTSAGFYAHRNAGEPPCEACADAAREHHAAWAEQKRAA